MFALFSQRVGHAWKVIGVRGLVCRDGASLSTCVHVVMVTVPWPSHLLWTTWREIVSCLFCHACRRNESTSKIMFSRVGDVSRSLSTRRVVPKLMATLHGRACVRIHKLSLARKTHTAHCGVAVVCGRNEFCHWTSWSVLLECGRGPCYPLRLDGIPLPVVFEFMSSSRLYIDPIHNHFIVTGTVQCAKWRELEETT